MSSGSRNTSNVIPSWGFPLALVFSGFNWVEVSISTSANCKFWLDSDSSSDGLPDISDSSGLILLSAKTVSSASVKVWEGLPAVKLCSGANWTTSSEICSSLLSSSTTWVSSGLASINVSSWGPSSIIFVSSSGKLSRTLLIGPALTIVSSGGIVVISSSFWLSIFSKESDMIVSGAPIWSKVSGGIFWILVSSYSDSWIFVIPCAGEPWSVSTLGGIWFPIVKSSDTLLLKPSCGAALLANPSNSLVFMTCSVSPVIEVWLLFSGKLSTGVPGLSSTFSTGDKVSKLGEFTKLFNSLSSRLCAILNSSPSELLVTFFFRPDFRFLSSVAIFITYNINDYYT